MESNIIYVLPDNNINALEYALLDSIINDFKPYRTEYIYNVKELTEKYQNNFSFHDLRVAGSSMTRYLIDNGDFSILYVTSVLLVENGEFIMVCISAHKHWAVLSDKLKSLNFSFSRKPFYVQSKIKREAEKPIFIEREVVQITETDETNILRSYYTYIMIDKNTNLYKIGKSSSPKKREKTLQSEKPTIELLFFTEIDIEKEIQSIFKSKRIRGEWFNLNNADIDFIKNKFNSLV